jgi:hypothetical protein
VRNPLELELLEELELELLEFPSELVLVDVFVEVFVLVFPAADIPLPVARIIARPNADIAVLLMVASVSCSLEGTTLTSPS